MIGQVATRKQIWMYRDADKSLARPTSRRILFDGENISFDARLVIYVNSTNVPLIMIINRIYEHQIMKIRNTWKVLKCGAGEGWKRSVGPNM